MYDPRGDPIEGHGVATDEEVTDDRAAIATGHDRAFEAAIAWSCQRQPPAHPRTPGHPRAHAGDRAHRLRAFRGSRARHARGLPEPRRQPLDPAELFAVLVAFVA
jgi:hypothetical protein